jgi:hypothetical protein
MKKAVKQARALLGWTPTRALEQGLGTTIAGFEAKGVAPAAAVEIEDDDVLLTA